MVLVGDGEGPAGPSWVVVLTPNLESAEQNGKMNTNKELVMIAEIIFMFISTRIACLLITTPRFICKILTGAHARQNNQCRFILLARWHHLHATR